MFDTLDKDKVEEVKKKSRLSVQERLLRMHREEKVYKERLNSSKYKAVPEAAELRVQLVP